MSEYLKTHPHRIEKLTEFAHRFVSGEDGKLLFEQYRTFIESISPMEAMQVFDYLLQQPFAFDAVKSSTGKIVNLFYKSLQAFEWSKPGDGHFIYYLMQENRAVEKYINKVRPAIKLLFDDRSEDKTQCFIELRQFINDIKAYELHYIKKENILFPYLEKTFTQHRCLQLMWSFHDDYRRSVKSLDTLLNESSPHTALISKELGKLFFVILPIIFREEQIIYPVALRAIPPKQWNNMLNESRETGWCFDVKPRYPIEDPLFDNAGGLINLFTGLLLPEQIVLMLNELPVDITFVDENDEVRFFSGGKHRIFPRSKAIIGRKVQNCHPPESVHVVNEIVDAFKNGSKEVAEFWIQMKGRFIHIRYYSLRDEKGFYKGTIEVSQDVTEILTLQGERRLLDWDSGAK